MYAVYGTLILLIQSRILAKFVVEVWEVWSASERGVCIWMISYEGGRCWFDPLPKSLHL